MLVLKDMRRIVINSMHVSYLLPLKIIVLCDYLQFPTCYLLSIFLIIFFMFSFCPNYSLDSIPTLIFFRNFFFLNFPRVLVLHSGIQDRSFNIIMGFGCRKIQGHIRVLLEPLLWGVCLAPPRGRLQDPILHFVSFLYSPRLLWTTATWTLIYMYWNILEKWWVCL